MSSKRILRLITILFFAIVIGTPLIYWRQTVFPYTIVKTAFFQACVELILALWIALAISDRRYRLRMTPIAWTILAYLGVLTAGAIAGVDPGRSFFSTEERAFGVVMFYHLGALALIATALSREIPWKKLWYASFGTSVATVGIQALQFKIQNLLLVEQLSDRPGATFGNPTFLAGYLLVTIFIAGYYLAASRSRTSTMVLSAVIVIDTLGIFFTGTRGDLAGLFIGVLALIVLFAVRPPETENRVLAGRGLYIILLVILVLASGLVWTTRGSSVWARVPGVNRLKYISFDASSSDILPRAIAYRAAWRGFLERPFLGWGVENFNVVFNKYYDPRALEFGYAETDFDKPHNVPLEELVSGGAPLFLAYVALFAALLWEAKRAKDAALFRMAAALTVAYAARSFVIFDTIGPAMLFYLLLGFVGGHRAPPAPSATAKGAEPRALRPGPLVATLATALVAAAIVLYALNITAVAAANHEYEGYNWMAADPATALAEFHRAVDSWSPYQWAFVRDDANTVAQAYFYNHAAVPRAEVISFIDGLKRVAVAHPADAFNHYLLADVYNLASDIDPKAYLAAAEAEAATALKLSPGRQEVYFYLAKTKHLSGDSKAAFDLAKRAVDLDPKVPDAHFYYGMLAFATGQSGLGMSEVKEALARGRAWRTFYEPRVAADYFADAGDLRGAIDLYRAALALQPRDLETEIKLGAAYYLNGDPLAARPFLADAATRFDFTKSAAYPQYKPILDSLGISP